MKAMVLAAGLGTRLRPLTDNRPKALVEVGGHTLLEITLRRLASFGIREVIVNVHHFADMVIEYLSKNDNFGMRIGDLPRRRRAARYRWRAERRPHGSFFRAHNRMSHSFCIMWM